MSFTDVDIESIREPEIIMLGVDEMDGLTRIFTVVGIKKVSELPA